MQQCMHTGELTRHTDTGCDTCRQSTQQGGDTAFTASPAAAQAAEREEEGSGVRCMVCLEDLKDGEMARLLPCFHKVC